MSYYNISPSNRVGSNNVTGQNAQNPDPMRPLMTTGGFRTRDVDPNELSSNQVADITRQGGTLMTMADKLGRARANSRGGINSTMAGQASQKAVLEAAMPMAMQQAGAYTNVRDKSMDAENNYLIKEGDWANARDINDGDNAVSLEIAGMNREDNQRDFDENARRYDVDYTRQQEQDALANRRNRENFIQSGTFNTIMGDPEIWGDPEGAMGFADYFMGNFSNMFGRLFPDGAPAAP
jgi:hypothetical protein